MMLHTIEIPFRFVHPSGTVGLNITPKWYDEHVAVNHSQIAEIASALHKSENPLAQWSSSVAFSKSAVTIEMYLHERTPWAAIEEQRQALVAELNALRKNEPTNGEAKRVIVKVGALDPSRAAADALAAMDALGSRSANGKVNPARTFIDAMDNAGKKEAPLRAPHDAMVGGGKWYEGTSTKEIGKERFVALDITPKDHALTPILAESVNRAISAVLSAKTPIAGLVRSIIADRNGVRVIISAPPGWTDADIDKHTTKIAEATTKRNALVDELANINRLVAILSPSPKESLADAAARLVRERDEAIEGNEEDDSGVTHTPADVNAKIEADVEARANARVEKFRDEALDIMLRELVHCANGERAIAQSMLKIKNMKL